MSKTIVKTEINSRNPEIFSDFFTDFSRNVVTGQLNKKRNEAAVIQSVRNLLLTDRGERLFHPEIGSSIRSLLFENATVDALLMTRQLVQEVFEKHEPRANLLFSDVTFDTDRNQAYITVRFSLINSTEPVTFNLTLERTR